MSPLPLDGNASAPVPLAAAYSGRKPPQHSASDHLYRRRFDYIEQIKRGTLEASTAEECYEI